ncbi:MAG: hypothetical protein GW859_08900 [Sphingomonadales bacterium]|nr:hypothetical protein [Sphingomonadales bacterium]
MKILLSGSAIGAALLLSTPALAQDHGGHSMPTPAPSPAPAPTPAPTPAPSAIPAPAGDGMAIDHRPMDHGQMDHGDRGDMPGMDHKAGDAAMATEGPAAGSGTSRLPGNEGGMQGLHVDVGGGWMAMAHGYAWGVYTDQSGPRGDDKLYVQSMAMLTASKTTSWGRIEAKSMLSLEPLMRHDGYPNLFATGEVAYGVPLVDRQHPHDLFMELAARVDVDVGEGASIFVYGGPVGEPAIGPSAFMHRGSATYNPEAPNTHHWFDATHITYGVVTTGFSSPRFQVEASAFRGREPDEYRWNIETPKLDSYALRATWTPTPAWAAQVSHARIDSPEASHPGDDEARTTASVNYADGKGLSAMAAFSNKHIFGEGDFTAWLAEASWDIDAHHTVFGRAENVKNAELFPDPASPLHDTAFRVSKFQAGYAYRVSLGGPLGLALGGTVSAFAKPAALDPFYGDSPIGYTLFAKLSLGH